MSLIKCPDCAEEVSKSADKCIHCGKPLKFNPWKLIGQGIIILIITSVLLFIAYLVFLGFEAKEAYKELESLGL